MSATAATTASARSAPVLSALSRSCRTGTRAADSYQVTLVTPRASRNARSRVATGGFTVEIAHSDASRPRTSPLFPGRLPSLRLVDGHRGRLDQLSAIIDPSPLEPGVAQVGHDTRHDLSTHGRDRRDRGCRGLPISLRLGLIGQQVKDLVE